MELRAAVPNDADDVDGSESINPNATSLLQTPPVVVRNCF